MRYFEAVRMNVLYIENCMILKTWLVYILGDVAEILSLCVALTLPSPFVWGIFSPHSLVRSEAHFHNCTPFTTSISYSTLLYRL